MEDVNKKLAFNNTPVKNVSCNTKLWIRGDVAEGDPNGGVVYTVGAYFTIFGIYF